MPLFAGGRATGVLSLQNVDRRTRSPRPTQRLLTTLAGSLSVALDNARLVNETRQRNAELALINSVQAAIAGELEPQAIYDIVGDKIQEVFDAQVVDIGLYDPRRRGSFRFRTRSTRGAYRGEEPRGALDAVPQARAREQRANRGQREPRSLLSARNGA